MSPIVGATGEYLSRIGEVGAAPTGAAMPRIGAAEASSFSEVLQVTLAESNAAIETAQRASAAFAAGTRDDIHGTMIALSKADIELRLVGSMRNKVIDAFHEIWKMQI